MTLSDPRSPFAQIGDRRLKSSGLCVRTPDGRLGWSAYGGTGGWISVRFPGDPAPTVCLPDQDVDVVNADWLPLDERWA